MQLTRQSFAFDCPPLKDSNGSEQYLKMTANRYTTHTSTSQTSGLTLLFAHCIGSHKEQWEPTIRHVFESQASADPSHRIREAWALDRQNHGDAAVLNKDILDSSFPKGIMIHDWAPAIASFAQSSHVRGHRIVCVGHSAGATTVMLSTQDFPTPTPYLGLILVEPTLVSKEEFATHSERLTAQLEFVVGMTSVRRDTWANNGEAFDWLRQRIPWQTWDPEIVRILSDYGLKPSQSSKGVTLKCEKQQEAVSYPDVEAQWEGAVQLARKCDSIPTHVIWGARNDLVPKAIKDSLGDTSQGRKLASVSRVPNAGHMVVQEQPRGLAIAICEVLNNINDHSMRSRL